MKILVIGTAGFIGLDNINDYHDVNLKYVRNFIW
jgi:hypothetical protein